MSNPEKKSSSAKKKDDEEEENRTNTDQAIATTTTTATTVVSPPTRTTVQVRPASEERKKRKSSAEKGGSSSSTKSGKQKRKAGVLDAPKGEPTCPICGSRFGSWKGYFGHLRVHPKGSKKRPWKGAFPPPTFRSPKEMADEQFQEYMASELSRVGHETLLKMRHEESSTGAANTSARNVGIDLNVAPEVDDPQTAPEFDLNLPPRSNIDSDDDDGEKDEDDAPAP